VTRATHLFEERARSDVSPISRANGSRRRSRMACRCTHSVSREVRVGLTAATRRDGPIVQGEAVTGARHRGLRRRAGSTRRKHDRLTAGGSRRRGSARHAGEVRQDACPLTRITPTTTAPRRAMPGPGSRSSAKKHRPAGHHRMMGKSCVYCASNCSASGRCRSASMRFAPLAASRRVASPLLSLSTALASRARASSTVSAAMTPARVIRGPTAPTAPRRTRRGRQASAAATPRPSPGRMPTLPTPRRRSAARAASAVPAHWALARSPAAIQGLRRRCQGLSASSLISPRRPTVGCASQQPITIFCRQTITLLDQTAIEVGEHTHPKPPPRMLIRPASKRPLD
jgi:hypothetical protein